MLKTKKRVAHSLRQIKSLNPFEVIEKSRRGIKASQFSKYQKSSPISEQEWAGILHLTLRTLYRYKTENKTFDPIASERILEVIGILQKGKEVFGNEEKFGIWLHIPSIALGGKAPLEFFDTSTGLQYIRDELGRIEYGVFA
jgi:putative toxin-antitoxin system antitoxin component (TIGR02293 family)